MAMSAPNPPAPTALISGPTHSQPSALMVFLQPTIDLSGWAQAIEPHDAPLPRQTGRRMLNERASDSPSTTRADRIGWFRFHRPPYATVASHAHAYAPLPPAQAIPPGLVHSLNVSFSEQPSYPLYPQWQKRAS